MLTMGTRDNLIVSIEKHFPLGFEWLYIPVGPVEPKVWNRKESITKNAKSILKMPIHSPMSALLKLANRGNTRSESCKLTNVLRMQTNNY